MKTYCIIRYELIESFGHCDAEDEADARKQWEDGKVDLGLADDTTERGPIKVFEVVNNEAGPDPDPLGSMTKLQERVRILRGVCEDARKELEAQATYFGPHLDPENNLFRILRKLGSVLEATKEES